MNDIDHMIAPYPPAETQADARMDQLRKFVEWERATHPDKTHIAEWALYELRRLRVAPPAEAQAQGGGEVVAQQQGQTVYQIENDPDEWFDVGQDMYEGHDGSRKRILYTTATPPSAPVGVSPPSGVAWHPIETAPKNNKRPLYLAQFDPDTGELIELDWDASWEAESESWEIPQVYYTWHSAYDRVEVPTHWAYQNIHAQQPAAIPRLANCGRYTATDNTGQHYYLNHANTWQAFQGQQPAAVDGYTMGHCERHKQSGGCDLHNLHCGWPACDRRPRRPPGGSDNDQ